MVEWADRIASRVTGAARLGGALLLAALVVPPVSAGVAVATLVYGPVPAGQLPDERPLLSAEPSIVVDANGRQIAVFRRFDRTVEVERSEIPEAARQAVVAIEDQRFWTHDGIDLEGIGRAARTNLELGEVAQGGSTITQQYVKNVYLSREKTLERKVEEALLAIELEKRMTKEEILFGYLTTSYFGEGAYGIGAAAEVYFAKPVSDLDVSEAAMLAGLVQAPTRLSPRNDIEGAERRRRLVLQAMLDQGFLTSDDFTREAGRPLWFAESDRAPTGPVTLIAPRPAKGATHHPYFVDWLEADLVDRFGPDLVYQGGLRIETSIDPSRQAQAEAAVAARLENTDHPVEMALVSLEPSTGHVVAMVGGRDHGFSQVNLATGGTTGFQPGSSFKPLVMATAFTMGIGPETVYPAPGAWTVPGCTGDCTVSNYDGADRGRITLREAMRLSVNTVFARLVLDVGVEETVSLGRELGLERLDPDRDYGASLALGAAETSPLEMASAYGVFANGGVRAEATGIVRVIDRDGNVLLDNTSPVGTPVVDPVVADNMTDVLIDVVESGTGRAAQLDRPVAGKTGTAQAYRAAWFVGYTPQLSTAIWMGHADGLRSLEDINGVRTVTGGSHPAVAWHDYMAAAMEGAEVVEFPEPAEIVPVARNAAEVARVMAEREKTRVGERRAPAVLAENCGGSPCQRRAVPEVPSLPDPEVPDSLPPVTAGGPPTGPPDTVPSDSTSTSTSTSSTSSTSSAPRG